MGGESHKVYPTSRRKLAKQEIREVREIGQAEDIRACIKTEREMTEQKKSTNALQPRKGRCDAGCGATRQQGAGGTERARRVAVRP